MRDLLRRLTAFKRNSEHASLPELIDPTNGHRVLAQTSAGRPLFWGRSGDGDYGIFASVVAQNEYRLPAQMPADSLVIDVGAHIGSFSYAALCRHAGEVRAFEPHPANFEFLEMNLRRFGQRASAHRVALWRSDQPPGTLTLGHYAEGASGVGSMLLPGGAETLVETLPFDSVLTRPVHLLKLDCEGSEYPILYTSQKLRLVENICGEYHEFSPADIPPHARISAALPFDRHGLKEFLEAQGFRVEFVPTRESLGVFFATRL